MDATDRTPSEHMEVQFEGPHRRIAMRASDWDTLRTKIPKSGYFRLVAAFKRFCSGCDNMPEQMFRRCAGGGFGRLEEFVVDGVLVIGRRGTDDLFQTFYTTEVRISSYVAQPVQSPVAPRQTLLPLESSVKQKGTER